MIIPPGDKIPFGGVYSLVNGTFGIQPLFSKGIITL
jgi:hypothetical protein